MNIFIYVDDDAALEAGGEEKVVNQAKKDAKSYHPLKALKLALDEWLPEISEPRTAFAKLIITNNNPPSSVIAGPLTSQTRLGGVFP